MAKTGKHSSYKVALVRMANKKPVVQAVCLKCDAHAEIVKFKHIKPGFKLEVRWKGECIIG